ncbi:hypothetical protein [Endozoicomonas acroporae]|uniref:hypothetical protein n=1 Tax=Endozoicomonas acroporae TaxID=1701104 RepID=UPI003D79C4C4
MNKEIYKKILIDHIFDLLEIYKNNNEKFELDRKYEKPSMPDMESHELKDLTDVAAILVNLNYKVLSKKS